MSAGTVCTGGMGVDTHMIAGVHACLTLPQTDLHLPIQTTPHYDEVLHPTALLSRARSVPGSLLRRRHTVAAIQECLSEAYRPGYSDYGS